MKEQFNENQASDNSNEVSSTLTRSAVIEGGKLLSLGSIVALGFLPLDYISHYFHTTSGKPIFSASFWRFAVTYSAISSGFKNLWSAYTNSVSVATIKNSVLSHRNTIHDLWQDKKNDEGSSSKGNTQSNSMPLLSSILSSISVGAVETTATQYHRIQKTWKLEKTKNSSFDIPKPQSFKDYLKMSGIGYPLALFRNVLTVGGFFITPALERNFQTIVPENYVKMAAVITTGLTIGTIRNVADILTKNQLISVDPVSMTAPSTRNVATNLYKQHGLKFITKGLKTSIVYSIFAFAFVPLAEKIVNTHIASSIEKAYDKSSKAVSNRHNFFNITQTQKNQLLHKMPKQPKIKEETASTFKPAA